MTSVYKLVEGVDFDEMGAEIYKDEHIRIVASGGIPVYTGVGYTGDKFPFKPSYDSVCGEGKGLMTFDKIYKDLLKGDLLSKFTPIEQERISKSFLNSPPLNESNMAILSEKIGELDSDAWVKTNKYTDPKDRLNARLKMSDRTRQPRMLADPLYSSHIYLRAPSCWPHVEDSAHISLRENLKGCFLPEYHYNASYSTLFAGAEVNETAAVGVVINVDPNKSFVFNSYSRVWNIPGEIIYGARITLSEYLLRLRDCGVGFVQPEMELYITPEDGFYPSEKFNACINNPAKEPVNIVNKQTGETIPAKIPVRSKQLDQLNEDGTTAFTNRLTVISRILKNDVMRFAGFKQWVDQNIPSDASILFKDQVNVIRKTYETITPTFEHVKSKIYPYLMDSLGVVHPEYLEKLAKVEKYVFKIGTDISTPLSMTFQELYKYFSDMLATSKSHFDGNDEFLEMTTTLRMHELVKISTEAGNPKKKKAYELVRFALLSLIGKLAVGLKRFGDDLKDAPALTLDPPPAWFPPSDATSSIELSAIKIKSELSSEELMTRQRKQIGLEEKIKKIESAIRAKDAEIRSIDAELAKPTMRGRTKTLKEGQKEKLVSELNALKETLTADIDELTAYTEMRKATEGGRRKTRRRRAQKRRREMSRRRNN